MFGLAFLIVIERYFHQSLHEAHAFILILAALGLTIHATIDGIALLPLEGASHAAEGIKHGALGSLSRGGFWRESRSRRTGGTLCEHEGLGIPGWHTHRYVPGRDAPHFYT